MQESQLCSYHKVTQGCPSQEDKGNRVGPEAKPLGARNLDKQLQILMLIQAC